MQIVKDGPDKYKIVNDGGPDRYRVVRDDGVIVIGRIHYAAAEKVIEILNYEIPYNDGWY